MDRDKVVKAHNAVMDRLRKALEGNDWECHVKAAMYDETALMHEINKDN